MELKIDKIEIHNYKSVYKSYFNLNNTNNAYILVGKNGTGKTKLLEAISVSSHLSNQTYNKVCTRKHYISEEPVTISFISRTLDKRRQYINDVKQILIAPSGFWQKFKVNYVEIEYKLVKNTTVFTQTKIYNLGDIQYENYCYRIIPKEEITVEAPQKYEVVKKEDGLDRAIYKNLTKSFVENNILNETFQFNINSTLWRPNDNNILKEYVDVTEFCSNPDISIPMKNIFYISGYKSNVAIARILGDAIKDDIQLQNLESTLSDSATTYINNIWQDSTLGTKLKFKISRDSAGKYKIQTSITSERETNGIYSLEDISDGFKQFLSIVFGVNIKDNCNNIIAIDEPEVHLHPSAAMYLKEKLLELGKGNYVFYSTHSPFMLDANVSERHYKVSKEDGVTSIIKLEPNTNMNDDELTEELFGINTLRDFYAPNRMLVEGQSEKTIINYGLSLLKHNQCIVITNGKGDNTVQVATYINIKKVNNVLTILDSDSIGEQNKNNIKSIGGIYNDSNVFCLKDIISSLPDYATIEDLLDIKYVLKIFKDYVKELGYRNLPSFNPTSSAIIQQIKTYCVINSIDLDDRKTKELKTRIAEKFNTTQSALKTKNQKLNELLQFIIKHFKEVNNA